MYRIKPAYLLWALDSIVAGHPVNRITVPENIAEKARISLNRMLTI
jgi:quinolinate synthase